MFNYLISLHVIISYDASNRDPDLGQAYTCSGIKPGNAIQALTLLIKLTLLKTFHKVCKYDIQISITEWNWRYI
jgi:hypothetical protein